MIIIKRKIMIMIILMIIIIVVVVVIIAIMIMMRKMILIIVVVIIINNLFQPGYFSTGSTTGCMQLRNPLSQMAHRLGGFGVTKLITWRKQ